MITFLGHLHPVLVHLPIGFLLLALLFLWMSGKSKYAQLRMAAKISLLLGTVAALISCITGYLLSLGGDYDHAAVGRHQNLALLTTAISLALLYLVTAPRRMPRLTMVTAWLLFLGLLLTGHFGGSLTHGSDYLTGAWKGASASDGKVVRPPIPDVQQAEVYADVVQPILKAKCYSCHGPDKQKGRLRLDDSLRMMEGGKDGKVILPGKADESELIKRLNLSTDDEDHMPPKEKSQLSNEEIALLHWWVQEGALFNKKVKDLPQPESVRQPLRSVQNGGGERESLPDTPVLSVDAASEDAIKKLESKSVVVIPVSAYSHFVRVSFIGPDTYSAGNLALLLPLKEQLIELRLSGQPVNDSALQLIGTFPHLMGLYLDRTPITDQGLSHLSGLKELRRLNLVGTQVTAQGLQALKDCRSLKQLYLYQTEVKGEGWKQLAKWFPAAQIDSGYYSVPTLSSDTTLVTSPPPKEQN